MVKQEEMICENTNNSSCDYKKNTDDFGRIIPFYVQEDAQNIEQQVTKLA